MGAVLRARTEAHGDRLAFRFLQPGAGSDPTVTYAQLDAAARAVAAQLRAAGAGSGARALLLYPPGLDYIAALFGCFYAGVVAVPAYPPRFSRRADRLRDLVQDADASFALTTPHQLERTAEGLRGGDPALAALRWLGLDRHAPAPAGFAPAEPGRENVALLQYTSGSTSRPKGVVLTHGNLLHNVALFGTRLEPGDDDRLVAWLPPYHDMGLIGTILGPVCLGMQGTTLMTPGDFVLRPARWLEAITRFRGTISAAPNFAYALCVQRTSERQREGLDLSSWRVALNGAERVRADTLSRFVDAFSPHGFRAAAFAPCYGLAESTLAVTIGGGSAPTTRHVDRKALQGGRAEPAAPGETGQALVGCGRALPGVDVRIVDPETGEPFGDRRVGEIWVASESVAGGYWNAAERSRETFEARLAEDAAESRFLRTGDLGFLDGGELYVTGRLKDLIVLLGVNHYPEDIEVSVERAHPRLRASGSVAFSVEHDQERLIVVAEVDRPRGLFAEEVMAAVRETVASDHGVPVHEVVLVKGGQLPRTSSGKPQRRLCRKLYLQGALAPLGQRRAGPASAAPQPSPERVAAVARAMAEVLDVEAVAEDDDFFALGGHSLLATQLVSRLSTLWQAELPLRAVFEAPTPRSLALRCESLEPRPLPGAVQRIDREGPLPLTHSQERMWFLHELEPEGAAYNVSGALVVEGPFVPSRLRAALQAAVDRHESLRTRILNAAGKPQLVIAPSLTLALPEEDLAGHPIPLEEATRRGSQLAQQPFDLQHGPLLRGRIYRLGSERHAVVVSMHHIVSDAWSMGVLLREVMDAYRTLSDGEELDTRPPELQYVDFAAWQRRWIETERFDAELRYWQRKLGGVPALELPTDHPREQVSSKGDLMPVSIAAELFEALHELAHAQKATPFMVMLAAFQVLLFRYTHQRDFAVGVPIANRNHPASEPLIGTLVNTLALRGELSSDDTFVQVLRRVRETSMEAYEHQNLPFERLVSELDSERRPGQSPLVQVMFDFQNPPMPPAGTPELRMRPLFISRRASQFDLSLLVMDNELGQLAAAEYRSDLFEPATIRRMLDHYVAILQAVVADPAVSIARIPLLSASERQAVVRLGQSPPLAPLADRTVVELIAARARETPDAPAIHDSRTSLSYAELERDVREMAGQLAGLGVTAGKRVAVMLPRSRQVPVAMLAAHWLGAAYVPLDPRLPDERIAKVLEDAAPAALITDGPTLAHHPDLVEVPILRVDAPHAPRVRAPLEPAARPDASAYLIYTSGSTGTPKGVDVPQRALLNFIDSMAGEPGMDAGDHLLSVTTVSFDIAALELFLPLYVGGQVTLASEDDCVDGRRLASLLSSSGANLMQATPATWRLLVEGGWLGQRGLRALCGGEALDRKLADALLARCDCLWNMYGPTETTVWSTLQRIEPSAPISIGRPIARTSVYVLDEHGQLVPPGVTGELTIGGAGVARGYHQRESLTRERFVPDPFDGRPGARMYRTGDVGRMRSDGRFECLGRLDHQVKIRGHRIELGDIEAALARQPGVRSCAVMAHEVRAGDTRLCAYYVAGDSQVRPETLRDGLLHSLPRYMVPTQFVPLTSMPITPSGKLDRRSLPPPPANSNSARPERVPPRSETERQVAELWSSVLSVDDPGVHDDFFDVGHSLLAAQLFAKIEQKLGVALPLATLFEGPTIAHLASRVEAARHGEGRPRGPGYEFLVPIRGRGDREPFFCVHGAGGNVLNFAGLARHLPPEQPLYGIQARGVDGRAAPFGTVEAMAEAYLQEVVAVQPEGPYFLGGYCGGGIVAYEMARMLERRGETVGLLALIDSFRPGVRLKMRSGMRKILDGASLGPAFLMGRGLRRWQRESDYRQRLREVERHLAQGRAVPYALRDFWLMEQFLRAVRGYVVRDYGGRTLVLRASEVWEDYACAEAALGWAAHVHGELTVEDVPGDHHTLADEPHVRELARALHDNLQGARTILDPRPVRRSASGRFRPI